MSKYKSLIVAMILSLVAAPVVQASIVTVTNSESVTFLNVNSNEAKGDISNETRSHTFTGGFNATHVSVTGQLTEVLTATWASEADIEITFVPPIKPTTTANGSSTNGYTGTLSTGPTLTELAVPFDPSGTVSMEFFESFNDGAGTDQVWDTVTVAFEEVGIVDGNFDLGALPDDKMLHKAPGSNGNSYYSNLSGFLDYFTFSLEDGVLPNGFLNVQTRDASTGDTIDSEIAIYDSAGNLIATDDDGQVGTFGGLYSMLSFGKFDPFANADTPAGADGATLAAGDYTVVVGGFNTVFGATIDNITAGTSEGDYDIYFGYASVPEPGSLALFGVFGLVILRRRKQK